MQLAAKQASSLCSLYQMSFSLNYPPRRKSKRCPTTFSTANEPRYRSSKSYATGQFARRETDNNSHHDEQSMTSITDFSKNSRFFSTCKMTYCWKSKNLSQHSLTSKNSGRNGTRLQSKTSLNRSKSAHLHQHRHPC